MHQRQIQFRFESRHSQVPLVHLMVAEQGVVRVPVLGAFAKHHQACSLAVYAVNRYQ